MTYLVARTCTEVVQSSGERISLRFDELRSREAYVLLGDPGSGKTESFKAEANACGGYYVSARNFLTLIPPESARGKAVFIDGLDESRAGEGDGRTPLDRIRQRLDELGRPSFRLSCREADWLGASDRHALVAVAPGGEVSVLHLDQLTGDQISDILAHHPSVSDPAAFLTHSEDRGLCPLLHNPQTLTLLIEAVKGNEWPSTRQETFRLACEKLASEPNVEHRSATRGQVPATVELLHAAGGLCAIQLLADILGFTETGESNAGIVALRDIACLNGLPISHVLKTRLFAGISEEQFAPVHRSVAEYLAARFLTHAIQNGLPIGRVLALMTAADGGTVAGLRGLHAWLSVHHTPSRQRLIEIDPLGTVLYGDTRHFCVDDKVALLKALHRLAQQHTGFRWQDWSGKPFGALATPDMVGHLKSILTSPSREEGDLAFLDCVVDAVRYGDPLPDLRNELRGAVLDPTRWPSIRSHALRAYMHVSRSNPGELKGIAEDIRDGKVIDANDEILGHVLHELFPRTITAQEVLSYLHTPKEESLIGSYHMFWARGITEAATPADVLVLLDSLVLAKPAVLNPRLEIMSRDLVGGLIAQGVRLHGDTATDERLYKWLGVAVDNHGFPRLETEDSTAIRDWLNAHPERYKGLLSAGLAECARKENFRWCLHCAMSRFYGAAMPADLGMWWLTSAEQEMNQEWADLYYYEAAGHFFRGQAAEGLSLEFFETWVAKNPRFANAHERAMYQDIPEWHREHLELDRKHASERRERKAEWAQYVRSQLASIRSGLANPRVLHDLALGYFGLLVDAHGETPWERLSTLLDGDDELVSAAMEGLKHSLRRVDLPSVTQIIELDTKGRMHFVRQACLAGLEELYNESPRALRDLSDEVLSKAVAFHYTHAVGNDREWFKDAVQSRPALVAKVLVEYVTEKLKNRDSHISGVYQLAHGEIYAAVARAAVPALLRAFPESARRKRVTGILDDLLKSALRYLPDGDLQSLISERLRMPNLGAMQRVYWLATGLIAAPSEYEPTLTRCIGKSAVRRRGLAAFFSDQVDRWVIRERTPERTLAYLVRMLAPTCAPDRSLVGGRVSPSDNTSEFVHALVNRLGGTPSDAAGEQLGQLLREPSLAPWHRSLAHAQHSQRISYREATFRHPTVAEACATLGSGSPANAADLAALTLEQLRELAQDMRHGNTDQYKQFWNVDAHSRPTKPRPEDACRDTLLERLKDRLLKLGVEAAPEGHYADDKRADIRVARTAPNLSMAVPVEIKRDSHPDLWTSMSDQLIGLYTRDPESKGRGIFVAFWFGGDGMRAPPSGDRPTNAAQLEKQLLALRPSDKRELISVCVIDCERSEKP